MFSSAGNVLTKLRSQLDPGTVDAILFLHKNYKIKDDEQKMVTSWLSDASLPADELLPAATAFQTADAADAAVPAPLLIVQPTEGASGPPLPTLFRNDGDTDELPGPCKKLKVEEL